MIKKTVTYTDFNGLQRTEDFRFNLSKAELLEMEAGAEGGMTTLYNKIIAAQDQTQLVQQFKRILLLSYGELSADGRHFEKSPELSKAFSETPVYDELFVLLATDTEAAIEFCNGILPVQIDLEKTTHTAPQLLSGAPTDAN